MPVPLHDSDPFDAALRRAVKPPDWVHPTPAANYNLVVLGGGPGGLIAAAGAAALGAKVALVERDLLGGDCLNVGCIPSKTLIRAAKAAHEARNAFRFGIHSGPVEVDFAAVMDRVRRVRSELAPNDSAERFRGLGVDVFLGEASFVDATTVAVDGRNLKYNRCIVATGSRPKTQGIPVPYLTNQSLFQLKELPKRLLVLGAGPVGCEMGQAFARLGSNVTVVDPAGKPLPKEHPDASALLKESMEADGVKFRKQPPDFNPFDAVLQAMGRAPNVEGLNLELAGIEFDLEKGIAVDPYLRTTNSKVYALGDVSSFGSRFTHSADAQARIALQNALFPVKKWTSSLVIPRCTYTDPEVASLGIETGGTVLRHDFQNLDRARTDSAMGFVELRVEKNRILGATVVGPQAGELIGAISFAMTSGLGLKAMGNAIYPYPTYTEVLKKLADQAYRGRLTPFVKRLLNGWFRWRRG